MGKSVTRKLLFHSIMKPRPAVISLVTAIVLVTISGPRLSRTVMGSYATPIATPTPATGPRTVASSSGSRQPDLGPGASLHGRQLFPPDNPWNQDISNAPVDPDSNRIVAAIGSDERLHPDFGTVYRGAPNGIPYMVVAGSQPRAPVGFRNADESDQRPYPIPRNAPIEGGAASDGDRHVLVIDRDNWMLYELFAANLGPDGHWHAASGAIFDLKSNVLRNEGWTSADAAGLPIFPGLVRYDEV